MENGQNSREKAAISDRNVQMRAADYSCVSRASKVVAGAN